MLDMANGITKGAGKNRNDDATNPRKVKLFTHLTTASPRGSVLLSHGFGEHHGRYTRFITALNDAGFDAYTFDYTGHGTSSGPRARVDVATLIEENLVARKQVMRVLRTEKLDLFGHSMGGLITLASALIQPTHLAAVAVTGPALRPLPTVNPFIARLGLRAARVLPSISSVALDDTLLSKDPAVIEAYRADPLVFEGKVPLLTGASMVVQGRYVIENAPILVVPTLIVHGDKDGLANLVGSEEFVAASRGKAELVVAEGGFHELLNEPEFEEYTDLIIQWYDRW